jgi:hypothetical protein
LTLTTPVSGGSSVDIVRSGTQTTELMDEIYLYGFIEIPTYVVTLQIFGIIVEYLFHSTMLKYLVPHTFITSVLGKMGFPKFHFFAFYSFCRFIQLRMHVFAVNKDTNKTSFPG